MRASCNWHAVPAPQRARYLRSAFIVGEACCLCLFEAEDDAAEAAVNAAARLPCTRIVEVLDLSP